MRGLLKRATEQPGSELIIDLPAQTINGEGLEPIPFEIDPFRKHRLLNGLDDIGMTMQHVDDITAFEATRPKWASHVQ